MNEVSKTITCRLTYIKRFNIMEDEIKMLEKQIKMLSLQYLRVSEDLELAHERINELEKGKKDENKKVRNPYMSILQHT